MSRCLYLHSTTKYLRGSRKWSLWTFALCAHKSQCSSNNNEAYLFSIEINLIVFSALPPSSFGKTTSLWHSLWTITITERVRVILIFLEHQPIGVCSIYCSLRLFISHPFRIGGTIRRRFVWTNWIFIFSQLAADFLCTPISTRIGLFIIAYCSPLNILLIIYSTGIAVLMADASRRISMWTTFYLWTDVTVTKTMLWTYHTQIRIWTSFRYEGILRLGLIFSPLHVSSRFRCVAPRNRLKLLTPQFANPWSILPELFGSALLPIELSFVYLSFVVLLADATSDYSSR